MIQVKICGINSAEAFDAAHEAGADWIGFVFFSRSPRYVSPETAQQISGRSRTGPLRVGLFVRPQPDDITRVLNAVHLDALQLYDVVEPLDDLRAQFRGEIWRAVGIKAPEDLPSTALGADRLVIEAKPPTGADRPGGNAVSFDWSITKAWTSACPWILAGGLRPDNVSEAIALSGAAAVDVSSGVESAPGVKSPELIRAFVAAAKDR